MSAYLPQHHRDRIVTDRGDAYSAHLPSSSRFDLKPLSPAPATASGQT